MRHLFTGFALFAQFLAPLRRVALSRRTRHRCIPVVLLGIMLLAGCIDNARSLVIMFAVFPEDAETCDIPVQDSDDFYYSASGLLDLNHASFEGKPFFQLGVQVHNFVLSNPNDSDTGGNLLVMIERVVVKYRWLIGSEVIQNNPAALGVEEMEHSMPISGLVAGADDVENPGRAVFSFIVLPKELGSFIQTIDPQVLDGLTLGVKIRLIGQTTGGSAIKSNEFEYPLYFCSDCLPGGSDCWPGQASTTSTGSNPTCGTIANVTSRNLTIGEDYVIRWSSGGGGGRVDISVQCGGNERNVVSGTANDGSHSWTVTGPAAPSCTFLVECTNDRSNSDTSSVFSISD